jgi:tetratricopeptide (TPR) repeat protein
VSTLGASFLNMALDHPAGPGTPWAFPAPPTQRRDEIAVLKELAPDSADPHKESLALALWRAVIHVRKWAELTLRERSEASLGPPIPDQQRIADSARMCAPDLALALDVFLALATRPGRAREANLLSACRAVSSWAENHGKGETALQFLEAAAAVAPDDAELANLCARACRLLGERPRGELWYERGIGLARTIGDPVEYIHGHLGFSTLLLERDEPQAAMEAIRTAGDTAKRFGLKPKAGEAYHDALAIAIITGDIDRAVRYAQKAVALYPRHHERYPALAYDLSLALVMWGVHEPAVPILRHAVDHIRSPAEQLIVWGTLARAAAGAGEISHYREAIGHVTKLVPEHRHTAAAALYSIGEAARLLGNWGAAEDSARRALELGEATGAQDVVRRTQALLSAVEERQPQATTLSPDDARAAALRGLAATVRLRIAKWRGPSWRPRRQPVSAG